MTMRTPAELYQQYAGGHRQPDHDYTDLSGFRQCAQDQSASQFHGDRATDQAAMAELCHRDRKGQVGDGFRQQLAVRRCGDLAWHHSVGAGGVCALAQSDAVQSRNLFLYHHGHRNANQLCDPHQSDAVDPLDQHATGNHRALCRYAYSHQCFLDLCVHRDLAPRAR